MTIKDKIQVEYMCQVNSSAWYNNAHVQKLFAVIRDDVTKEKPNFPTRYNINECVGHNQCCHRKCEALNGKFWIDKMIYTPGDTVAVRWKLNSNTELKEAELKVIKNTTLRYPNPDHPMSLTDNQTPVASRKDQLNEQSQYIAVQLPKDLPSGHKRTIWDTSKLSYFISYTLKMPRIKKPLELRFPIAIQGSLSEKDERQNATMTEMEYDMFNVHELEQANKQQNVMTPQYLNVNAIRLKTNANHTLEGATAEIELTAQLNQHYVVHFLLQGSVCVAGRWYSKLARFRRQWTCRMIEVNT
uniref:Arrestin_N domain-containing protein n=1 Tax=Panagrellus redivivus TaxID=6233 RepID=A0A7E4VW97_PANRE